MDLDEIRKDLAAFADPGTDVRTDGLVVQWTQNRERREATLVPIDTELPDFLLGGRRFRYAEFFASELMADLRGLAESLPRYLASLPAFVQDTYVESRATAESGESGAASEVLGALVNPATPALKTRIVFLRGRAGDGKSALLTRCAYAQALAYGRTDASWLYLYVDAQGSTLARLDEVIARVTQDLRARFTYHAVARLARLGLLVPIVDGFDELLGVGGYRDAFSSLALFVSRMGGGGAVVASARSTFYQYTTFGQQAARLASDDLPLDFEIVPAELEPWGEEEAGRFLRQVGIDRSVRELRQTLGSRAEEILSSPFLLSSLARYADLEAGLDVGRHLIRQIVGAMIEREMVQKLLDPQGKPLLTLEQHMRLLGALAEEMWWQESRELDEQTFLTIGELVCEEFGLEGIVAERFLNRMPTHALLARSDLSKRVSFRHEFYFGYFLGSIIALRVLNREPVNDFLTRAVVSSVVADEVAATIRFDGRGEVTPLVEAIRGRRAAPSVVDVANQNAGTLFAALVREFGDVLAGTVLQSASFNGVNLARSRLRGVELRRCVFVEVDLRDCEWREVRMTECELVLVKVSDAGRLEVTGLSIPGSVVGLRHFPREGYGAEVYDPKEIGRILATLGCEVEAPVVPALGVKGRELVRQLDQLLRTVQRTLYFSEEDFRNRRLSLRRDLEQVFDLLKAHGLLVRARREIRGQREMYRLMATADDIRRGEAGVFASVDIREFWKAIRAADGPPPVAAPVA
jgi:hypothetical protein